MEADRRKTRRRRESYGAVSRNLTVGVVRAAASKTQWSYRAVLVGKVLKRSASAFLLQTDRKYATLVAQLTFPR